jgi:hypothetical protein
MNATHENTGPLARLRTTARFAALAAALLALFVLSATTGKVAGAGSPDAQPQGAFRHFRYDWNNDGCSDVFDTAQNGLEIWKGTCAGATWDYQLPTQFAAFGKPFDQFLLPGDWDQDGCRDLFGITAGELWLLRGNCDAGILAQVQMPGDFSAYNFFVAPGFFTTDLFFPDLLARRAVDGALVLFTGDGDFGFTGDPTVVGTGWDVFDWILGLGDMNGDSCADLAGRRIDDGTLRLYPGDCMGGINPVQNIQMAGGGDWADFDWLFSGGNWGYDQGLGCPDIVGWTASDATHLAIFRGNCTGDITLPRLQITSGGWNEPFAGDASPAPPAALTSLWGDADCNNAAAPRDAQAGLKHFLSQTPISVTEPCPSLGELVSANGNMVAWGDWDCNGAVAPRDSQAVLTSFLQLPPISQTDPCPEVGQTFSLDTS